MIAITGASGNLGKATISFLLGKIDPASIVAIVRSPEKLQELGSSGIQVRIADYDDPASLKQALAGCEKLLQISSSGYGDTATRQERQVVDAATQAGVKHIVYTSTLNPGNSNHFWAAATCGATEEAIRNSGMQFTFFRNSMYMETIPQFIGEAMETGQIYYPGGDAKISFVLRVDIAEALSNVLSGEGHQNKTYHITGDKSTGFKEIAALLKATKNLAANYFDVPNEEFGKQLAAFGMPAEEIDFYLSMADSIKANEFAAVHQDLELLLGHKRITIEEFMKTC